MKTNSITILAAVFIGMVASASAENALQMAKAKDLPGKFEAGACDTFAKALFDRFDQAGVPAYRIVYQWENLNLQRESGAHALIVFQDERGRYYGIDNQTWKPVWLQGETPREWVKFFTGMEAKTQVVSQVATSAVQGETRLALR